MLKVIDGFIDYAVDEEGVVWTKRSCTRVKTIGYRRMRSCKTNKFGHRHVKLMRDGKHVQCLVHRLVLEAFVGPCPAGMVCRHFPDRNPANNRLENLSWGTRKENEADKVVHGTSNRGERNGQSKLTLADVEEIRRRYALGGITQLALGREYGVSDPTICNIVNRKAYR